jgi:uncharacterized protein YkwD
MPGARTGVDVNCMRTERLPSQDQRRPAQRRVSSSRRALALAIATLIAALAVVAPAAAASPAHGAQTGCAAAARHNADVQSVQRALFCLHNQVRRQHGLRKLRWSSQLAAAAAKHARDMVRRHYFEHLSPSHKDHMDRIAAGHYPPTAGCWSAGENLYYSTANPTPRQILAAWMNSPAHRANILRHGWRHTGLAVTASSPNGQPGLTIVALFATRTHHNCH